MASRKTPGDGLIAFFVSAPFVIAWITFVFLWRALLAIFSALRIVASLPGFWRFIGKSLPPLASVLALSAIDSPAWALLLVGAVLTVLMFFPNQVLRAGWWIRQGLQRQLNQEPEVGLRTQPSWISIENPGTPPPRFELSPKEAENLVREWMVSLGYPEAKVTQYSQDGGVDVLTDTHAIQVKRWRAGNNLGVREVRELFGVATKLGKKPVFFITSSATRDAIQEANEMAIPIVRFEYIKPLLVPLNNPAQDFLKGHQVI